MSPHETRDANVRRLAELGLLLCLTVGLAFGGMAVLMRYLLAHQPPEQTRSLLAVAPALPPAPRLQIDSGRDLAAKRQADSAALDSYGWVNRSAATVHIPIDRAIDLLATKNGPAPAKSQAAAQRDQRSSKP